MAGLAEVARVFVGVAVAYVGAVGDPAVTANGCGRAAGGCAGAADCPAGSKDGPAGVVGDPEASGAGHAGALGGTGAHAG